jgi:hypothetical protein
MMADLGDTPTGRGYRTRRPDALTFAESIEDCRSWAAKDWAAHEITEVTPTIWRCKAPRTRVNSWHIARIPGSWVVWGDIGDLLVTRSDDVAWIVEASKSPDYFWAKVPEAVKVKVGVEEVYLGDFLDALDDPDVFTADEAKAIWDLVEGDTDLNVAICAVTGDAELCIDPRMGRESIRCMLALEWFAEHMGDLGPPPWRSGS